MNVALLDCLNYGLERYFHEIIPVAPRKIGWILKTTNTSFKFFPYSKISELKKGAKDFDVLLITAMQPDFRVVRNLIKKLKSIPTKIVGGPIANNPKLIKKLDVSACVIGEGEKFLLELIKNDFKVEEVSKKFENVITAFKEGKPVWLSEKEMNEFGCEESLVTSYPFFEFSRVFVEVVRGCSNFFRVKLPSCTYCGNCESSDLLKRISCPQNIPPGCGYCSVPTIFGYPKSREKKLIVSEIKELVKLGARRIVLSAPDFLDYKRDEEVKPLPLTSPHSPPPNLKRIEELLKEIFSIREIRKRKVFLMIENLKPNLIDEEVASLLGKYFKGTDVHIGCETGCNKHLKFIGRPFKVEDVINATRLLTKEGIKPHVYFIYGLPFQTQESARKTIEVMKELYRVGVERIITYKFLPLPFSAFQNFPKGEPFWKNKESEEIVKVANEINFKIKEKYVGRKFECFVAGKFKKYWIGYPLTYGTNILIRSKQNLLHKVVVAKVKKVYSHNLLVGELEKIVSC